MTARCVVCGKKIEKSDVTIKRDGQDICVKHAAKDLKRSMKIGARLISEAKERLARKHGDSRKTRRTSRRSRRSRRK